MAVNLKYVHIGIIITVTSETYLTDNEQNKCKSYLLYNILCLLEMQKKNLTCMVTLCLNHKSQIKSEYSDTAAKADLFNKYF